MWMIDPREMCRNHLLGEHRELHTLAAVLEKGRSIRGHIEKGQLEPLSLESRHRSLVREMVRRGWNHRSPIRIPVRVRIPVGTVDREKSREELGRRCPEYRRRMERGRRLN